MALLPSTASYSSNIADRLSKPLPTIAHQRIVSLIGAGPTDHPLASATPSTPSVATATVASLAAVVASAASVPSLHSTLNLTLPTLDTGDSVSIIPSRSDFLPVAQAPYGLF